MKLFFAILTLMCASAQDIFVPMFDPGVNGLKRGALAYYPFTEGSGATTADLTGHGYTLTMHNTALNIPWTVNGRVGNGAAFSGKEVVGGNWSDGDNFEAPANWPAFSFPGKHMTITAWFKSSEPTTSINMQTLIWRGNGNGFAPLNFSWSLLIDTRGSQNPDQVVFYYTTDGAVSPGSIATCPAAYFNIGSQLSQNWNFVTVRWDGLKIKISLTDEFSANLATEQETAFTGTLFENATATVRVGESIPNDQIHDTFGNVDELGIWDTELTLCQLKKLFDAKNGTFTWSSSPGFDFGLCQ